MKNSPSHSSGNPNQIDSSQPKTERGSEDVGERRHMSRFALVHVLAAKRERQMRGDVSVRNDREIKEEQSALSALQGERDTEVKKQRKNPIEIDNLVSDRRELNYFLRELLV